MHAAPDGMSNADKNVAGPANAAVAKSHSIGRPTGSGSGSGRSSWLEGLWLGSAGTPQRRFCTGGGGGPSSPHHHQPVVSIAEDIRDDRELFFADDAPAPTPASSRDREGCRVSWPPQEPRGRRRSGAPGSSGLPRRSSQRKMETLQWEVDRALEYFSMENEIGLDDDDFDGDDYLRPEFRGKPGDDGTAATSQATSVVTGCEDEFGGLHSKLLTLSEQACPSAASDMAVLSPEHRTKSIISLPLSLLPSSAAKKSHDYEEKGLAKTRFENAMAEELDKILTDERSKSCSVDFDSNPSLRSAMEPFLAIARLRREEARKCVFDKLEDPQNWAGRRVSSSSEHSLHIGSNYGIPYPSLRNESSFLYDVESFPLDKVLAKTLGVSDLSRIHVNHPLVKDKARLMAPLRDRGRRRRFRHCFDTFVTSQVIPLLHSQALSKGVFYTNRHQLQTGRPQRIVYRYQAFPSINIVRPGECSTDPLCDVALGYSIGNISFHVPLTATFGTNAVYTESRPGREDFHPLIARSPGLGFQFDGTRCIHFDLKNGTDITRVSLNFRIAIVRALDVGEGLEFDPDDQLCCPELLADRFSMNDPGFYDEVVVNVGDVPRSFMPGPVAVKRRKGGISVVG